jgi:hypothetical protein
MREINENPLVSGFSLNSRNGHFNTFLDIRM